MESIRKRMSKKAEISKDGSTVEIKPHESRLKKFKTFIWNPNEKSVLGRTSISWAKISLYYAIFYILLGGFFILLFGVFITTLNKQFPTFYNIESVMDYKGVNPGMGFRPMPELTSNLIIMDSDENKKKFSDSYKKYVEDFLIQDRNITNAIDCLAEPGVYLEKNKVCLYSFTDIVEDLSHPCSMSGTAGYYTGSPCVIIKLNRIIEWIPRTGNSTLDPSLSADFVYFKCEGYQASDIDLFPNVTYYSLGTKEGNSDYGSLPFSYFPYRNVYDYIPPFVIVHFHSLPERYVLNVLCKAYAPNIDNTDIQNLRGMVHLQLFYNPDPV